MRKFKIALIILSASTFLCQNLKAQTVQITKNDSLWLHRKKVKKELLSLNKVPIFLISAGLYAYTDSDIIGREDVAERRNQSVPNFKTHADDYLQYTPIVASMVLNAFGVKGEHSFSKSLPLLIKSELLMLTVVTPTKQLTHQLRPDGSNYSSFPSGHTAQAFVAATFLHEEFGKKSPWISIGGYTAASSVGLLRILNNRHFSSDVLVGAGIGILSTKLVYYHHRNKKAHSINNFKVLPYYTSNNNLGVSMSMRIN